MCCAFLVFLKQRYWCCRKSAFTEKMSLTRKPKYGKSYKCLFCRNYAFTQRFDPWWCMWRGFFFFRSWHEGSLLSSNMASCSSCATASEDSMRESLVFTWNSCSTFWTRMKTSSDGWKSAPPLNSFNSSRTALTLSPLLVRTGICHKVRSWWLFSQCILQEIPQPSPQC